MLSKTTERYGAKRLPVDHAIEDWGVTYDELEAHYTRAEVLLGISGKAGNIRGKKIEGGNIFEGWRSAESDPSDQDAIFFGDVSRCGTNPWLPSLSASRRDAE